MGKNKGRGGKKPSVFKLAGAKSLKAKSKAQPITGNLKKINEIVRKQVIKVDKNFVVLQNSTRQKKDTKVKSNSIQKEKINEQKEEDLEKEKQVTLKKLGQMQF